jgi:hypothetical protein
VVSVLLKVYKNFSDTNGYYFLIMFRMSGLAWLWLNSVYLFEGLSVEGAWCMVNI